MTVSLDSFEQAKLAYKALDKVLRVETVLHPEERVALQYLRNELESALVATSQER